MCVVFQKFQVSWNIINAVIITILIIDHAIKGNDISLNSISFAQSTFVASLLWIRFSTRCLFF